MTKPIKIGVVGCGYWGPNLVRNFRSLPDCHLKMMCDTSEDRLEHLKSLYPEVQRATDYGLMLNGVGLDAVVIATAVKSHYPMAKASLLAGKHTFIEKPMAGSSGECEELMDIARKKGLVLMTGHTFLYSPVVRKIKEIMEKGDIGDIRYICARRLNLGLFQKDINVAWDLAPHDISIVLSIMGEQPTEVNCRGSAHITPGIEDVTTMCLTFPKQRTAIIHNSWLDPRKVREMTIVGSKRMIVYDDVAPLEKIRVFDARVEMPAALRHFCGISIRLSLRRHVCAVHQTGRAVAERMPAFSRLHQERDDAVDGREKRPEPRSHIGSIFRISPPGRRTRPIFRTTGGDAIRWQWARV